MRASTWRSASRISRTRASSRPDLAKFGALSRHPQDTRYLSRHPVIREPADLAKHQIIAMTHFGLDSWSFPPLQGSSVPRAIQFAPRLVVNTVRAAVASAAGGHGVTRLVSYHIAEEIPEGRLPIILSHDGE